MPLREAVLARASRIAIRPIHLAVLLMAAAACADEGTAPLVPARIEAVSSLQQTAVVGSLVGEPPRVRVLTESGQPVGSAPVTFSATGGGSVGTAAVTDADGYASAAEWRVGTQVGVNELHATAAGTPSVTFSASTTPAPAATLAIIAAPSAVAHASERLRRQPIVQLRDMYGNDVPQAGVLVTATVSAGTATILNGTAHTDAAGRAAFTELAIEGAVGSYAVTFSAAGLASGPASSPLAIAAALCATSNAMILDMPLGHTERFTVMDAASPRCLEFDETRNAGQQYLVLFENMPVANAPRTNEATPGLYPGPFVASDFTLTVRASQPVAGAPATTTSAARYATYSSARLQQAASAGGHEWDFGDGPIYEGTPAPPPPGVTAVTAPVRATTPGMMASVRSAVPAVGDTIQMWLAGIPRLGISDGVQKAVVRYVSNDLVFADDIRLGTTLFRPDGSYNQPLTIAQMDTIATEYAAKAKVQGDLFFQNRHNDATEVATRTTVVSTLMYSDNIWGYTYSSGNYFAFDYWVGNTEGFRRGNNQVLQRVADDLFMHEIAHMRHYGMLQHAAPPRVAQRGNQWLTEGFARFSERLPIAMRLLGSPAPSRTSNFVLDRNPVFNNSYFFDDVPTYLEAGSNFFDGYAASSFVFDYIADQVAFAGGDWMAALRDVLTNGGTESTMNGAVGRWLPGLTFPEVVTRARIALYADDYGVPGLPSWTQYHQYQLRASRPAVSSAARNKDPRNAWPRVVPGTAFADSVKLGNGTAFGYLLDGSLVNGSSAFELNPTAAANGIISVTRLR